jgi:hypothetical protein
MSIFLISSATSPHDNSNTLITNICITGAKIEEYIFANSFIPTGASGVTRAADEFEEVDTPYPSMVDALGSGITTIIIGHPLTGAESAAMSRLNIEVPTALRD